MSTKTTRKHYRQQLDDLKLSVLEMGLASKSALTSSLESLELYDDKKAKELIKDYSKYQFSDAETNIEKECVLLVATQAPVSSDLRLIESCFKIVTEFKRIGNTARRINRLTIKLSDLELRFPNLIKFVKKTSEIVIRMLDLNLSVFNSLNRKDSEQLESLTADDDEIDELYKHANDEIVKLLAVQNINDEKTIRVLMDLILVLRHLERAGDHACNIGERIYYIINGKRIQIS